MYKDHNDLNRFELRDRYNASVREQNKMNLDKIQSIYESRKEKENVMREFQTFKNDTMDFLVTEALSYIPIRYNVLESEESKAKMKNTIYSFVKENGATTLLNKMNIKTRLLSEMSLIVENTYNSIIEKCDSCKKDTFNIMPSDTTKFYRSLENMKADKVGEKIRDRVEKAIEDLVQGNMIDKVDMEETAEKIRDKVNSLKNPSEEVKQEFTRMYTREVNEKRDSRPKNLLECIFFSTSYAIVKNEKYKNQFLKEHGKIDFPKIREISIGSYTALETLNTINLMEMNTEVIKDIINGIK